MSSVCDAVHQLQSCRLPIRQSRQLLKVKHGVEAGNFSVKKYHEKIMRKLDFSALFQSLWKQKPSEKNVLLKHFLPSFINSSILCFVFMLIFLSL